VTNEEKSDP